LVVREGRSGMNQRGVVRVILSLEDRMRKLDGLLWYVSCCVAPALS
jgi:hypothetical protein